MIKYTILQRLLKKYADFVRAKKPVDSIIKEIYAELPKALPNYFEGATEAKLSNKAFQDLLATPLSQWPKARALAYLSMEAGKSESPVEPLEEGPPPSQDQEELPVKKKKKQKR